jgi:hypothetical protein
MSVGGRGELDRMEEQILDAKHKLSSISRERRAAALAGRADRVMEARLRLMQKTLENCGLLVEYVRKFSEPIAREIEIKHKRLVKEFDHIREVESPVAFHEWIRSNVVPVVRQSEQAASLAATVAKKSRGEKIDFHRWVKRQTR